MLGCCIAIAIAVLTPNAAVAQDKANEPPAGKTAAQPSKTGAKPAAAKSQKPPADTKSTAVAEQDSDGEKALQEIYACIAKGLPEGWQRAWVVVTEISGDGKERTLEGRFQVSLDKTGDQRWNFVPCNSRDVAERVYRLNDFLEPEKRGWKVATLLFMRDGKFELKYDYTR